LIVVDSRFAALVLNASEVAAINLFLANKFIS